MGRPTKYREEYVELGYKYCLLGATDEQLAEFMDVSRVTISTWKLEHEDFADALTAGKAIADSNIAQSLYQRGMGYSHSDTHVSNYKGEITKTEITKHYPPDTTACIFWLKNRQPALWRDKRDVEHSGNLAISELLDEIDGTSTGLPE